MCTYYNQTCALTDRRAAKTNRYDPFEILRECILMTEFRHAKKKRIYRKSHLRVLKRRKTFDTDLQFDGLFNIVIIIIVGIEGVRKISSNHYIDIA